MQAFKLNLWDNLQASNRCGQCHGTGGQVPSFVRSDDINLAYEAANSVVDLGNPGLDDGHEGRRRPQLLARGGLGLRRPAHRVDPQLGRPDDGRHARRAAAAAADQGRGREQVVPGKLGALRFDRLPGADAVLLALPLLGRDHAAVAVLRGGERGRRLRRGARQDQPRLRRTSRASSCACATSSTTAGPIARRPRTSCWPRSRTSPTACRSRRSTRTSSSSKALTLYDGTVASGGNRFDNAAIALYEFKTGTGTVAYDTSGVEPAANLTMSGGVTWVGGWGIDLRGGKAQGDDRREPQAPRPHQGDGRILDRGLGRTGQRRAGAGVHRQLLRRHDGAQLHARPDDVQLRLLQPRDDDRRERRRRRSRRRRQTRCCRRRCSTWSRPTTRSTAAAST